MEHNEGTGVDRKEIGEWNYNLTSRSHLQCYNLNTQRDGISAAEISFGLRNHPGTVFTSTDFLFFTMFGLWGQKRVSFGIRTGWPI